MYILNTPQGIQDFPIHNKTPEPENFEKQSKNFQHITDAKVNFLTFHFFPKQQETKKNHHDSLSNPKRNSSRQIPKYFCDTP